MKNATAETHRHVKIASYNLDGIARELPPTTALESMERAETEYYNMIKNAMTATLKMGMDVLQLAKWRKSLSD